MNNPATSYFYNHNTKITQKYKTMEKKKMVFNIYQLEVNV